MRVENPEDLGAFVLDLAKKSGADDVLMTVKRMRYRSFDYRSGQIEKADNSLEQSLRLNIYVDGRYSEHVSSNLDPVHLRSFVRQSVELTRMLDPNPWRQLPARSRPFEDGSALDLCDPRIQNQSSEDMLDLCQNLQDRVRRKPRILSVTSSVGEMTKIESLFSSQGDFAHLEKCVGAVYADLAVENARGEMANGGLGIYSTQFQDLLNFDAFVDPLFARLDSDVHAARMSAEKTYMVLDPWNSDLIVKQLLRAAMDTRIHQNQSFLQGKLHTNIASSLLHVQDDPLIPGAAGSRLWDNEGLAAEAMPFIQEGRLENFFVGDYLGRKLGLRTTTAMPSNSVIRPGQRSLNTIIQDLERGVLLHGLHGGNMDVTTGDFSFVFSGRRIEKGVLTEPLKDIMVTGNMLELLQNLIEVGNDPWLFGLDQCHSPTLVFENVQLSG